MGFEPTRREFESLREFQASVAQRKERQLAKLKAEGSIPPGCPRRSWLSGRAPAFQAGDASSSLAERSSTFTIYLFMAIVGLWRNRERACLASRGPGFESQLVHQYAPVAQRI